MTANISSSEAEGNHWQLNYESIYVNGKTSKTLKSPFPTIFDSGTSNVVFPKDITEVISLSSFFFFCKQSF
jgi:hypothetical protein